VNPPPTPEEIRNLAARLGHIAEIQAIVLRKLHWSTQDIAFDRDQEMPIETMFNLSQGRAGDLVRYQVNSTITGRGAAGEVFRLEATHEAFFSLPESDTASEQELAAFGTVSVFFMVFPYIRELVHAMTGNAGLPPILLRPLRVPINPASGAPIEVAAAPADPAPNT
jgi:preprotein translocase subunit SecB